MVDWEKWTKEHYANENVFKCGKQRLLEFLEDFSRVLPKRLFVRHELPQEKTLVPSAYEFLDLNSNDRRKNYFSETGLNCPYPPKRKKVLKKMVEELVSIASKNGIPIVEGDLSDGDDWTERIFYCQTFAIASNNNIEDTNGSRTKKTLDDWLVAVRELPPKKAVVDYNFEELNKQDSYRDDAGVHVVDGCYTLHANIDHLQLYFYGKTIPTAKHFLGKGEHQVPFPLSDYEDALLRKVLFNYAVFPLREEGFIVEGKTV